MTFVDTCGWIEWLTAWPTSTVQYELYKWVKRESDENTALDIIALSNDSLIGWRSSSPLVVRCGRCALTGRGFCG